MWSWHNVATGDIVAGFLGAGCGDDIATDTTSPNCADAGFAYLSRNRIASDRSCSQPPVSNGPQIASVANHDCLARRNLSAGVPGILKQHGSRQIRSK